MFTTSGGDVRQADLVCFRGQAQLDLTDPATVLVGGTVDILSIQDGSERESTLELGGWHRQQQYVWGANTEMRKRRQ